jgi:hypothetical protein
VKKIDEEPCKEKASGFETKDRAAVDVSRTTRAKFLRGETTARTRTEPTANE